MPWTKTLILKCWRRMAQTLNLVMHVDCDVEDCVGVDGVDEGGVGGGVGGEGGDPVGCPTVIKG